MKTKLTLLPLNGGAFNCRPAQEIELPSESVLCNNVVLPWDFNPHNVRLWCIGNEYGAICAVWAESEQDALDEMVDQGLGDSFVISDEDQQSATEEDRDEWARLGNAGEPCNLDHCWMQLVRLDEKQDCRLLCKFAQAAGECAPTF